MPLIRADMTIGIVVRRTAGVTRWAKYAWKIVAVLPGAGPADWRELRRDGETIEYHAATLPLTLYSSDTEAYLVGLSARIPGLTVVMEPDTSPQARMPWKPRLVTASPYEGQDYGDSGELMLEVVPMPEGLIAWIRDFAHAHHVEEPFIKRKRDRMRTDQSEPGKGDSRVRQLADVYRAPQDRGGT